MRSRLAYTLTFWLLSAVALSVLALGGVTAWNLRQGFSAYLQARDVERLDKFVALVATRLEGQLGSSAAAALKPANRIDMLAVLRELDIQEGNAFTPQAEPRRPGPGAAPPGDWLPPRDRLPPPPMRSDGFGARVSLLRPDGQHWIGPMLEAGDADLVERPVIVQGAVVALARLRPRERAPEAQETQFLQNQYTGILIVATVLLLLAAAVATWLARQWVRPLAAVQAATARIAHGELNVRISIERSDEIGDVMRNVNAMTESLQRIEGARRRWLADLSHELRTPLTVLRGEIEALVDGVRPLSASAMISLREDVLQLGRLVEDLHLLAMADLSALPCHFGQADAPQIVARVLGRYAALALTADLTLCGPEVNTSPMPVHWDAARIEQVLGNLLQNSLRYTDAPGRVEVVCRRVRDRVVLTVDDSAPGVAHADLDRLFDPLYRADAARSREKGGSGLGLAICAAIIQAHGGRISARPSALGGLTIRVELPVRANPEHA